MANVTRAYLNCPQPHMTLHGDSDCQQVRKMRKVNQRQLTVDRESFTRTITQIRAKEFRLGSDPEVNDFWLSVDFGDPEFEEACVRYAHRLLCQRYSRLKMGPVERHC